MPRLRLQPQHPGTLPTRTDVDPVVSKNTRRFYRTTVLGILAMAALVWAAIDQFGLSPQEMGELFLGVVLVVVTVIAVAAFMVFLWIALRRIFSRADD